MIIRTKVQKQFVWEVEFDLGDDMSLIEKTEQELIAAGLKAPSSSPSQGTDSRVATPARVFSQSPNSMNNVQAGDTVMCNLHKMPLDRVTTKGTAYHSYKGKNCSGTGWWGDKAQS